ncbi:uncharacterized protein V6R79_017441 [Siganus canaliculatus]
MSNCRVERASTEVRSYGKRKPSQTRSRRDSLPRDRDGLVAMTPLLWMLAWLPQVLSAMSQLPQPGNLTLNSTHFHHMLTWKPGPGTPPGVYYRVTVITDSSSSDSPVSGCQRVQRPLQCNLTAAFPDPNESYLTAVTAVLDARTSPKAWLPAFRPIRDTLLDLPRLAVTYDGGNLRVDLQPPDQRLRSVYKSLDYRLKLESSTGATEQKVQFNQTLLQKVDPGRQYCVSVCFWDSLVERKSSYSRPVCVHVPGPVNTDALIAGLTSTLVLVLLGVLVLLVSAGFMCLPEGPLPRVLETSQRLDRVVVAVPCAVTLSPVTVPEPTAPSRGQRRKNSQTSSDESDEETTTERVTRGGGGGGRGGYELRAGAHLLSSSSSASSSAPLCPEVRNCSSSSSSNQTPDSSVPPPGATSWTEPHYSLRLVPLEEPPQSAPAPPPPPEEEEHQQEEEEEEEEVNLLTLTFGEQEEEEQEEEEEEQEEELSVESFSALLLPQRTLEEEEAAAEAVCCSVQEEEEESGYMSRCS